VHLAYCVLRIAYCVLRIAYCVNDMKSHIIWFILTYLRFWARMTLQVHKPIIIGVAGSIGKSSTRNAITAMLRHHGVTKVVETNSESGIPLGILGITPTSYSAFDWLRMMIIAPFKTMTLKKTKYAVIEMGIDDPYPPKNMEYLLSIVKPDIGVITQESAVHTEQFEKILPNKIWENDSEKETALIEAITKEDLKMITQSNCSLGIVEGDNPYIRTMMKKIKNLPKIETFGWDKKNTIICTNHSSTPEKTAYEFRLGRQKIASEIHGYILPKEYHGSIAVAVLIARHLQIPINDALENIKKVFILPKGRATTLKGIKGSTIIDSSYNASKQASIVLLDMVKSMKAKEKRPVTIIFGDMLELGPMERHEHEEVAKKINEVADQVLLVGPKTKQYMLPMLLKATWYSSYEDLNTKGIKHIKDHSIILVKGSQGTIWLEETVKILLKNKKDISRLCRQNTFWKNKKKKAHRWIEL